MEYDVYGSLQIVPELWMDRDLEARVLPHDRAEFPLNILERWILGFAIEMGVDGLFQLVVFFPCFHWFVWTRCLSIGPRSRHTTLSKCIGGISSVRSFDSFSRLNFVSCFDFGKHRPIGLGFEEIVLVE